REEGRGYDLMVGAPALFGMVQMASMANPERMVLIPCIHDEGAAYAKLIRSVLASVRGCIFNSVNERKLVGRMVTVQRSAVVGTGYHIEDRAPISTSIPTGRYVLYAGRMEPAKRVPVVAEYFTRWRAERGSDLRLVLVGDGPWSPPAEYGDAVDMVGTFDDDERRHIVAGALCVINGSEHESLSNLLLEAWREGRPTLAAAGSEVMTDTSSLSGGGLMFGDYGEFALAMDRYEADHDFADRMGASGREFMEREYSWDAVGYRFRTALAHMAP
ncbi:MAG: glycosyltransferase, partial [Thermoleophilia bacterium]